MKRLKRMIAGLLNFAALSVLLLGSCAVPGVAYFQSPRWFLEEVGPEAATSFFVALRSEVGEDSQPVQLMRFDSKKMADADARYQLPGGRLSYSWGPGEGSAIIDVTTEERGNQLIRVFVVGDTPWTSLSEYRVVDSKVHPLRHAHSAAWLLLGIPICLLLSGLLRKPIERSIKRLVGVESE